MHRLKLSLFFLVLILIPGCSLFANKYATQITQDDAQTSFVSANGRVIALSELDAFVDQQMADLDMPGLSIAVISGGQVVYTRAAGIANRETGIAVDEDSIFEAASLSKPVFAYFTLRLVEKGVLSLDLPLHTYLPMEELEYDPRYHSVTARMVLSHATGFPNWRWFDPAPVERNIERGTMYMKRNPGEFGYSGEGYNYLAQVIAHLTNNDMTTIDDLFQDEVAKPLGLKNCAFIKTEFIGAHKVTGHKQGKVEDETWPRSFPDDTPLTFGAAGRLHTNARNYALFMTGLIEGQGLGPEIRNDFFKEQTRVPEDSETRRLTGVTAWGLGIAIEPTPYGTRYEHGGNNGGFQSGMMLFLERGLGFVFFTNSDKGAEFNQRLERFVTVGK